jgi:hypothetical protein
MSLARDGIEIHRNYGEVPTQVKVMGERSSGTNYVKRLFSDNTALQAREFYGWKHGFAQMAAIGANTLMVGVVRDPLAWLRSMHAKPWHAVPALQSLDFSEFIRSEWLTIVDNPRSFRERKDHDIEYVPLQQDRHPISGLPFENLLNLRTFKAAYLLGYRNRECNLVLVRMEYVLEDPLRFLNQVSTQFGLAPVNEVKPIKERLGSRFPAAVENRPQTPKLVSDEDKAFIRSQLDEKVETALGYPLP